MSAELAPPEAVREDLSRASLPTAGGLLSIFGVPWLLLHHPSLCLVLHGVLPQCVQISPVYKDTSYVGLEAYPSPA